VLTSLPGVVSVSGYFGGDGFHHAIAATSDGKIHDIFWPGNDQPRQEVVAMLPGVVSVSGYFTPSDGFQHVIAATTDGNVHEFYFKAG
jgi:hypothetical protein